MELDFIKNMFDTIAPKYDFLNHFLSMGQDISWRSKMVSATELHSNTRVLDIACGTGDVSLEVCRQTKGRVQIAGVDFSPRMLAVAQKKADAEKRQCTVHLAAGNALNLPFRDHCFHAVFIAFGIRNIMDRPAALTGFYNTLKKGGKLAVLELTTPDPGFFKTMYMLYFKKILPLLGGIFSKNAGAYEYLPASVLRFPEPFEFAEIMSRAGFTEIKWKRMTFGIVTLFVGTRG